MTVCMYVTKFVIVNYGQMVRVFFLLHTKEWLDMVLKMLNIERHQNYMIGSKVTMILTTIFVHDY